MSVTENITDAAVVSQFEKYTPLRQIAIPRRQKWLFVHYGKVQKKDEVQSARNVLDAVITKTESGKKPKRLLVKRSLIRSGFLFS